MTKEKKPSRMPVSEKRRSAALAGILGGAGGMTSRSATTPRTRSPASASREPDSSDVGSGSSSSVVISPPPRAQLGGQEDEAAKDPTAAPVCSPPPPPPGALLREKDQRIADLECELDQSAAEFASLLDTLSQKESDSATFWQDKAEQAAGQLAGAEGDLRLARAEVEARDADKAELTSLLEALAGRLSEREREAAGLRAQVRGLKEFVSTSTRTDGRTATSDEVFGDGMARLGNGLQNWIIVHFRKARLDTQNIDEHVLRELEDLAPMYQDLSKVHLLQTLVSRILVETIFDAYYVGLSPEQTRQFREMEATLSSLGSSEESVNQWRSTTLTLLQREDEPTWQALTDEAAGHAMARINRVLDGITDAQGSEARDHALHARVLGAIDLSRLLRVQRAVFAVHMPPVVACQPTLFDPATMEDVGGEEDEDALARREISCVTFPGIVKHGDESGGRLHYLNVIAKARVLCSQE